ncbi:MAG: hypothetical protein JXO44_14300 [Clostridia bacterium]|nr:hypothetical protein [Clostridia bacterium]
MIDIEHIKRLSLILLGILIVFTVNDCITTEKKIQNISNTYPVEPFSAELLLITSAGQSTDAYIFHDIANNLHLNNHFMPEANTYNLRAYSSVVFVVGYSQVGMMLNEVTYEEEFKRVQKIVQTAQAEHLPIIATYLGGNERRSKETDALMEYVCSVSDYIVITADSDRGPFIDKITENGTIPITCVRTVDQISMPLAAIFK